MKPTIPQLVSKKTAGEKIVMLTCYDASFARILEAADVDVLLVGDSLGVVIQGRENTLPVTLEEVIYHTRCVTRGARETLVIADLPFMSYQVSQEQALVNAGRCLKEAKAQGVKLEGGLEIVTTVRALTNTGIPVMGHIGLRPQTIHQMGGYKIQGKTEASRKKLLKEALALQEAGCFSIVLEGVTPEAAKKITEQLSIPTVGIASGPFCDGQVLVLYDLLGMDPAWEPKFVKRTLQGAALIAGAVQQFAQEVRLGRFPAPAPKKELPRKEEATLQ